MPRVSPEAVARDREKSRLRAAAKRAANREAENKRITEWKRENRERVNEDRRLRYGADMERFASRSFIGWDGEGYTDKAGDHHYMLFGCSMFPDSPLIGRSLGTRECLDYMLYVESVFPDAFHVGYAINYDVNMILRDLPARTLKHLSDYGVCHWQGYRIAYIPGKRFTMSRGKDSERVSITIFDVFGFFLSKYVTALVKYDVATEAQLAHIVDGKDDRPRFTFEEIERVLLYWQDEISYMPKLMETLREMCYDNGLFITQWHGPGALASYILRKRGVRDWHSKDVPEGAQHAIQCGYAGGRFHPWRCGLYTRSVYTADINSAYIFACSLLPRLDNGTWEHIGPDDIDRSNIARFGIYRIAYEGDPTAIRDNHQRGAFDEIYPLFHRDPYKRVSWPRKVEGWFWTPEATTVASNPRAEFLEAWIYHDDGTSPFRWVNEEYNKRLALQRAGNSAEKTLKWALAAMYGAFARRVGWDRKNRTAPASFELAWAGFITSWCRAQVYKVGFECWRRGGLISIDTDGVTSSVPFDPAWFEHGIGEKLGQWKLEEFAGILYWQTGFYWLKHLDGTWGTAKTRGVKRGTLNVEVALAAYEAANYNLSCGPVEHAKITKYGTRFITWKQALARGSLKSAWRWEETKSETVMGMGGSMIHVPQFCKKCRTPDADIMHVLTQVPSPSWINSAHYLPWQDAEDMIPQEFFEIEEEINTYKEEVLDDMDLVDHL